MLLTHPLTSSLKLQSSFHPLTPSPPHPLPFLLTGPQPWYRCQVRPMFSNRLRTTPTKARLTTQLTKLPVSLSFGMFRQVTGLLRHCDRSLNAMVVLLDIPIAPIAATRR